MLPGRQWWTRLILLPKSVFSQTISIDSDRFVCISIAPVFAYLPQYDMLGVSAGILPGLDNCVLVFRNDKSRKLVHLWEKEQLEFGKDKDDQHTLSRVINKMANFRAGVLDQSWQMRYIPANG
ncbi:hypothetical protein M9434_003383 [Picochlorum sp. BPE23]|nr:hypothetical protein M9434_003383 [Picochlorum sp. BPE23]